MMSPENVEIIRELYNEFLSKPDRLFDSAALGFFDPDVEIRQSTSLLGSGGTFHGYEGIARSARELFEVFRDLCFVPLRLVDSGDHVVATVEAHAYGKDSGVEVKEEVGHVWKLRDGRVVAWHVYWDPAQALKAVGLPE